jgi:hypothetical protein
MSQHGKYENFSTCGKVFENHTVANILHHSLLKTYQCRISVSAKSRVPASKLSVTDWQEKKRTQSKLKKSLNPPDFPPRLSFNYFTREHGRYFAFFIDHRKKTFI